MYPSYYLFFFSLALLTNVERMIKIKINPLIVPGYNGYDIKTYPNTIVAKVYWWACWPGAILTLVYIGQVLIV
jgi:hypothetical protein